MRTASLLKPLAICLSGVMVAGLAFITPVKKYVPRSANHNENTGFAGAADYYHWLKKDPTTGKLNLAAMSEFQYDMYNRFNGTNKIASTPAIDLEWQEMGPDNIGGRCRAIVIDKNNPNRLFAGGVSAGIFMSTNGGTNWAPINDQMATLVISCMTQDGDGNIYIGTGEGMARGGNGDGNSAFIGGGVYVMTYDPTSDTYAAPVAISSTVPTPNSTAGNWIYVNRIATSPVKHNGNYYIYAATNLGLYVSTDNGTTWASSLPVVNKFTCDVDVCNDGTVYVTAGPGVYSGTNKVYRSSAVDYGQPGTFSDITPPSASPTTWANMGRIEIAAARSNSNVVYISIAKPLSIGATLLAVLQSTNGGTNWTNIGVGTVNFEPFASYGQGDYDHVLEVYPDNAYEILLGGVDMYVWAATDSLHPYVGSWDQYSDQFSHPLNYSYMHADKHAITFHPSNPNIIYFGTDGGVFRTTTRSGIFTAMNKGFNATQFYAVAAERDALWSYGPNTGTFNSAGVFGGAQDNGTPYISGNLNTVKSGESINGGDGFYAEASMLSPSTFFYTSYYGYLERTANRDGQGEDFYPGNRPTMLCGSSAVPGDQAFASFNTPISLWESGNVTNGLDSVEYVVDSIRIPSILLASGTQNSFTFTIPKPQTSAFIVETTLKVIAGNQTATFSGGNFNPASDAVAGTYANDVVSGLTFAQTPSANTPIKIIAAITYAAGDQIQVTSASMNSKFSYVMPVAHATGDTFKIMDPIQARLAVGLNGAVYVCKNPLNFSDPSQWIKVASANSVNTNGTVTPLAGYVQTLEWGGSNNLYVATNSGGNGYLYRISNLNQVVDVEQDVDSFNYILGTLNYLCSRNKTSPLRCDIVGTFSSRSITSIAVDPTNPDRIAVTLGNYNATNHVYYCGSATTVPHSTGTTNFSGLNGMQVSSIASPVYSSTFVQTTYNEVNPKMLLIGTETGVYSINLDSAATTTWQSEGNNPSGMFPNVPTFMLRQQTYGNWEVYNAGIIYAATHGRGFWQSKKYYQPFVVGVNEQESTIQNVSTKAIKVFPNPANDFTTVNFTLGDERRIAVSVYDLKGSKLKTVNCGKLLKGTQNINVDLNGLSKGTYIIAVSDDHSGVIGTCRFIKVD